MNVKILSRSLAPTLLALGLSIMATPTSATVVVYDFDGVAFADSMSLTTLSPGLSFSHATVLKAGISLNDADFPPRSGDGVVFDDGGAISISFATPVFSVGGYFTHVTGLSFSAFDSGNQLLGTVSSAQLDNTVSSGGPPNEFLSFADAGGTIARILISGDVGGASFVMDDLTVDNGNTVPEPQTLLLALALLGVGCLPRGWMRRRSAV